MPRINKKQAESAFTLIELLVAIAIMGVLTIIALPAVNKIKMDNDQLQYKKYKDSFITAGKLYNDSFAEDLFGRIQTGCAEVKYSELEVKDLVKEIQVDGVDCSHFCSTESDEENDSKIRIRRSGDQYYYEAFMCCTKEDDGTKVYETNNANHYNDACEIKAKGDQEYPKLDVKIKWNNADPKPEDEPYKITSASTIKAIVTISDVETGNSCINKNGKFHYEWLYSGEGVEAYTVDDSEGVIIDDDGEAQTADDVDDDEADDANDEEEDINDSEIDDTPDDNDSTTEDTLLYANDAKLSSYITNGVCKTQLTITLNAPSKITDKNLKGMVTIKITPTDIRDVANNRIPINNTVESDISIDNIEEQQSSTPSPVTPDPDPVPEPGAPTVKLYKFTGDKTPPNETGLKKYKNNTWFAGNVYTVASGGNTTYYRYTVRGKSKHVTKKLGKHRALKANGKSTIKYCSARTTGEHKCVKWSPTYTIKLDEKKPKCSISKSNTGSTSGVTLKTTCKDSPSGVALCAGSKKKYKEKYVVTKKKIKKSVTYTVKDRAGNSNTCKATVTAQRQKRTRTWNNCKTTSTTYSCSRSGCRYVAGMCSCSYQFPNEGACLSSWCHATKGGHCQNLPAYTNAKWGCNVKIPADGKTKCTSSGWNAWGSWYNVSSCKKSNSTSCRTIYK